jgi:hypothetical protein
MFIPYPRCLTLILIYIHSESQISDPTTTKEGGGEFVVLPFLQAKISQN